MKERGFQKGLGLWKLCGMFQRARRVTKLAVTTLHGANKVSWTDPGNHLFAAGRKCVSLFQ